MLEDAVSLFLDAKGFFGRKPVEETRPSKVSKPIGYLDGMENSTSDSVVN